MTTKRYFRVKPLPCGVPVVVAASGCIEAVERVGCETALVERTGSIGCDEAMPRLSPSLVSLTGYFPAVHFVGFRSEEYWSAVRVFGLPDVVHRGWDSRAFREIGSNDTVVFGPKADPDFVSPYTFDDSNEPDDPAAAERRT